MTTIILDTISAVGGLLASVGGGAIIFVRMMTEGDFVAAATKDIFHAKKVGLSSP